MFYKCKSIAKLLGIAWLFSAVAAASSVIPGTLNYVEGSVTLNGDAVTSSSVGKSTVDQGQVLSTAQGKAEMLLTPGVFLRIGNNAAVRMVSPNLTDTRVALLSGEATVEVAELSKENRLQVGVDDAMATLVKRGVYEFNADHPQVAVYDGEARVSYGDSQVKVKKGHEAQLTGSLTVSKFNTKNQRDELYAWSNLRSEYEAQASANSAQLVLAGGGPGWYGPGWYWNPWWDAYGFLPGDGILYSPFGWPFFSPGFAYYAPVYFGWGGRHYVPGFPRGGVPRGFAHGVTAPRAGGFAAGTRVGGVGSHAFSGGGFGGHMGGGFGGGHAGGGHR